jgi:AcrR family transcriptional regulator
MGKDENIKTEIVTQAARLFRKWGYNKTTIEDIAKASGKGKSSLYYYFGDKEEIFLEVIKGEADEMNALVKQELLKCSSPSEELETYIETYIREFARYGNVYNIVCGEMGGNMDLLKRLAEKLDAMQIHNVRTILESGVKSGEFHLPLGADVTLVARLIVNSIEKIQLNMTVFNRDTEGNSSESTGLLAWLFLNGLRKP